MKNPLVKIGIFGALAFAAYKFFPKVKTLVKAAATGGRLNVQLTGVRFQRPFAISFRIVNPTDGSLSVKAIAGDVIANGSSIATFVVTNEIKIAPNSQQQVNIPLKVNPLPFAAIVTKIVELSVKKAGETNSDVSKRVLNYFKSMSLKITGTVNAAGVPIKIDQNIYN